MNFYPLKFWHKFLSQWASPLAKKVAWLLDLHPHEWQMSGNWLIHKRNGEIEPGCLRIWVTSGPNLMCVEIDRERVISAMSPLTSPDQAVIWVAAKEWIRFDAANTDERTTKQYMSRRQIAESKVEELLLRERSSVPLAIPWRDSASIEMDVLVNEREMANSMELIDSTYEDLKEPQYQRGYR